MKTKSTYKYMALCITMVRNATWRVNELFATQIYNSLSETKAEIKRHKEFDKSLTSQKFRYHILKFKIN